MGGRVEAPGAVVEARASARTRSAKRRCVVGVEGAVQERRVDLGRVADELGQRGAQRREHLAHLGRRHPRLVVVEQRRVRAGRRARSTRRSGASARRSRAGREGTRRSRRSRRASTQAWWPRAAARVISTRSSVGHAAGLLPVAAGDADQARVVRVVRQRLLERREPVEQPADLGVGEPVVDDAAERCERLGAGLGPERRHRHALLPAEHACSPAEIGDLREPLAQVLRSAVRSSIVRRLSILRPCARRPSRIALSDRRPRHRRHVPLPGAAPRDPARRSRPVRLPRARRRPARLRPLDGGRPDPRCRARHRPCTRSRRSGSTSSTRRASRWLELRLEWSARACAHAGLDARRRAVDVPGRATSTASAATASSSTVDQAVFDGGAGSRPARSSPASGARRGRRRRRWRRGRGAPARGRERRRGALARRRAAHRRAREGGDAARLRRRTAARPRTSSSRPGRRARRARDGARADHGGRRRSSSTSGRATTRPPASPT